MKKTISLITAAIIASLVLTGCSNNAVEKEEESNIPDTSDNAQIEQVEQEQDENDATAVILPESDENAQSDTEEKEENVMSPDDLFDTALSMIDHPVDELYSAIGEPEDKSYASSCIGDGQDGELYYPGFIVCTYLDGENETVVDVYK